ncbi:MAG: hypothetical protein ISS19_03195 [Bacteroidales bacterium]|nr:hypothetical protein [Bacteroidales bacterium]
MNEKLVVLWTSGDREVALKMAFMYTFNAKKMIDQGVNVEACKTCADMYGVSPILEEAGVDVKFTGTILTNYIKEGRKILSL